MRIKHLLPIAGAVAALGVSGVAAGAPAAHKVSHDSDAAHKSYSAWDKQWLQMSIEGDLFEIAGGKIAQDRAQSDAVKAYGKRLVEDHTKTLHDAVDLANELGIEVPKAPSPSQQWELQAVSRFSGRDFDQQYVDLEAKDHQQDISETKDEIDEGFNQDVRQNAKDDLPVLQEHLKIALSLGGKLGEDPLGGHD